MKGWTDKIYSFITQTCDANEMRPDGSHGGVIVILAEDMEKDAMERKIKVRIPKSKLKGILSEFLVIFSGGVMSEIHRL